MRNSATEWTPPTAEEIGAFFEGLGIRNHHDLDAEIAALPDGEFRRRWLQAGAFSRSGDDAMAFAYQHAEAIGLVLGGDFHQITALAALLTALPPLAPSSTLLDVGGGPGHLALWMLRCWPSVHVTVLDRVASSVARDWTPALAASGIRFVDGEVPAKLTGLSGERFDRVVVARMLKQDVAPGQDVRPFCRLAVKSLERFVALGGDLIIIDLFHDQDERAQQSLGETAKKLGFNHTIKGWRLDPHDPWQLRFVKEAIA